MKVTAREEVGSSRAGPMIYLNFELDSDIHIRVEQIKTIVNTLLRYYKLPHVNIISITGGYDSYDAYSLDFDTFEELFDYIDKNSLNDASWFILQTGYGLENLDFGFELWTNRMNVGFRLHDEVDILLMVRRIEFALLFN